MEALLDEFLKGAAGSVGRYSIPILFASGGLNLAFFWAAVTRPRTARNDVSKQLIEIEQLLIEAYQGIESRQTLVNPKRIEEAGSLMAEKLGFLATMESMKDNLRGYEKMKTAIRCAESIKAFGAFARRFSEGASGKYKFNALQDSGALLQDIAGLPETLEQVRRIIKRKRREDPNLRPARNAAIKKVAEEYELCAEEIFLSIEPSG